MEPLAELIAVKHAAAARLLERSDGVVGVGVGPRLVAGRSTGEPAVRVYVEHKRPLAELAAEAILPSALGAFRVDVVETGRLSAAPAVQWSGAVPRTRQRVRPVRPGCSAGVGQPMAGTVGAVARDRRGDLHLISCNHVFADEGALAEGAPIFQPALLDEGRRDRDQVASLSRVVALQRGAANRVDCAAARLANRYNADGSVLPHARLLRLPPGRAQLDAEVQKSGRSTGHTRGVVIDVAADLKVFYRSGVLRFAEQILIEGRGGPFSRPGDSGALVLDLIYRPVGLLFAGSPSHTVANPIDEVMAALQMELVS
jgi:hypothetical protein